MRNQRLLHVSYIIHYCFVLLAKTEIAMRRPSTSEVLSSVAVALVLAFFGIALSSALPCEGFAGTTLASAEVNVSQLTVSAIPNQGYTGKALATAPWSCWA